MPHKAYLVIDPCGDESVEIQFEKKSKDDREIEPAVDLQQSSPRVDGLFVLYAQS
jgi:hypothetical protein